MQYPEYSPIWRPNIFFFWTRFRDIVWCIKNRTHLFINLSSIVWFSKWLCQGVPYKAENWHALSREQYFLKNCFLDISWCACNDFMVCKNYCLLFFRANVRLDITHSSCLFLFAFKLILSPREYKFWLVPWKYVYYE